MNPFKKALSKESTAGAIFTLPFTIGFLLFMIVPMGISLYYSFCKYDILSPPVFTGLDNFVKMFQDETFYKAIGVTFYFALVSVPLRLGLCADRSNAAVKKFKDERPLSCSLLPSIYYRRFRSCGDSVEENVCYGWCS